MLFWLFVVQILSQKISLCQGHTLDSRAPIDSCDDINNCRRLFDIVWGCLTTIFACTWVAVHPNLPPSNQGRLAVLGRRLGVMLIAVVAPEIMVAFAARQFMAARRFSREFHVSLTHGFFICMGGFVSRNGHHPITTKKRLQTSDYTFAIQQIEAQDITDKSNGDTLSKGVAFSQGLWFVAQCLARFFQHLPVTQLEVATLAFAVVNVLIWSLWWSKPLDVERPIVVGSAEELQDVEPIIPPVSLWDTFWAASSRGYISHLPLASTSLPTFWSVDWDEADPGDADISLYTEYLVGTVFGTIHCAAWNSYFPSVIEMWMWRSSSLLVVSIPAALGLSLAFERRSAGGGVIAAALGKIAKIVAVVSFWLYPPRPPVSHYNSLYIPSSPPARRVRRRGLEHLYPTPLALDRSSLNHRGGHFVILCEKRPVINM
ncbi:hypothetical protein C8F04DRAFT_1034200 [Mycena alexandri]|uniref:Uncharacterized protein n=1 Tax=Mycena alexandri TaxID=1745969 RepID=A0AAD6WRU0_9AGAR|nr:hypothetical protein C8F04DRAFT_1011945 [Mycena alexandri]KAJ7038659.1 hypothetical protein C8F04DRAFT_1034200 [Mycena alexandri]